RRVSQLLSVWVYQDGAHVAIALVHEKSMCPWTESRKWLRGPVVHSLLCRNQLPCPQNEIADVEFHASAYRTCPAPMVLLAARLHTSRYVPCRIENPRCSGQSDCRKSCASKRSPAAATP